MRDETPRMRSAPPRHELLARGLIFFAVGVATEIMFHPVVPWTFVPGTIILVFGIGVALGVLEKFYPRWADPTFLVVSLGIGYLAFQQETSFLPIFLYASAYYLTRWVLSLDLLDGR